MKVRTILSIACLFVVAVAASFTFAGHAYGSVSNWLSGVFSSLPICLPGGLVFPCLGNSPFWGIQNGLIYLGSPIGPTLLGQIGTPQIVNLATHVARCNVPDPTIYGLTVGTVYCIKGYIGLAAAIYTENLRSSNLILTYQAACYSLAVAILGVRMTTMHTQEIGKEVFLFVAKLMISVFLVSKSVDIYVWLSSGMGQLVGLMTNAMTMGAMPKSCFIITPLQSVLTLADPSVNYTEYQAWHYVDCLLMRLTGATASTPFSAASVPAIPATVTSFLPPLIPSLIGSSTLMILITALTTSTIGFGLGVIGVWTIVSILKIILKSVYLTLLAYLLLAMIIIMLPLFAPLLVFNSHRSDSYTRKIFDKWVNQIASAFLQPALYVGFLSFAVVLIHAFFEGQDSDVPAVQAVFAGCTQAEQSNRICSFNQLFRTQNQKIAGVASSTNAQYIAATGDYSWITSSKEPLVNWRIMGDPQTAALDCGRIDRTKTYIPQNVVNRANQMATKALSLVIPGPDQLKEDYIVMLQGMFTLLCIIIIVAILSALLDMLPELAKSIVNAASISLIDGMKMPMEGMMNKALTGAKNNMDLGGGRGLLAGGGVRGALNNVARIPGQTFKGVQGMVNQVMSTLIGKR